MSVIYFAQATRALHNAHATDDFVEVQAVATLALVEATRDQTAVLQQFLDFVKSQDAEAVAEIEAAACTRPDQH